MRLRSAASSKVTTVGPPRSFAGLGVRDLFSHRELLYFLIWRDLKVRYKQTFLGAAWALVQPLLLMVIFTIVFGRVAGVDSEGIPYPLFAFAALVPWTLFSQAMAAASLSIVSNSALVAKVYLPRLLIPFGAAGSFVADLFIATLLLFGLMVYYGQPFRLATLWLPVFSAMALIAALGIGCMLAALFVRYRDVRYASPFLVQALLYVSPVGYSAEEIDPSIRVLYSLNPMSGAIEGFRWAMFGGDLSGTILVTSAVSTVVIALVGLAYFQRAEQSFADVI